MSANSSARPHSRRSFLAAGTAVAAIGAPIPLSASPDLDADLRAALARYEEADRAYDTAVEAGNEPYDRYFEMGADRHTPEALYENEGDRALHLYASGYDQEESRHFHTAGSIVTYRQSPRRRVQEIPHPDMPLPNVRATWVPDLAAQARAEELIAAWDAWQAEIERRKVVSGWKAAEEAEKATYALYKETSNAVVRIRARTPAGVALKVAFVAKILGPADLDLKVNDPRDRACSSRRMAYSIVRDLVEQREVA